MTRLALACLLSVAAFAQESGSITGKISDTFGEAVASAAIQVKNPATGALYRSSDGNWDGDTFVVDTTGLNDRSMAGGRSGTRHPRLSSGVIFSEN